MQIFLMRSIPGAGKSTWIRKFEAKNYQEGQKWNICSADHYHTKEGLYLYVPSNAKKAYNLCLEKYLSCLQDYPATEYLFVDNTNTLVVELAPYYRLAELFDIAVTIIQLDCDFATACKRNTHKVPPETIWRMYQNILSERMPVDWKVEIWTQEMLANF